MKIFSQFIFFVPVVLFFFASYGLAESKRSSLFPDHLVSNQQAGISEQTAVSIAQKQINGRVLTISRVNDVYRIKILSNQSTVHIVSVNAIDGKIIPSH